MKELKLSPERRQHLAEQVQTIIARDFDESLSALRAGELVGPMTELISPGAYNQAVANGRAHRHGRLA